ncbi:hypothetical protein F4677DRAFT_458774 [Hypoxylon crocopeplum]|nr:hypothetical protein F4677DRAFT_458774 [Hypoxylon crocopeplum]
MGPTFLKFTSLTPELRAMIWGRALHYEASSRILLLHSRRVIPNQCHYSPPLLANKESRSHAQKFYSGRLGISRVPTQSRRGSGSWPQVYDGTETSYLFEAVDIEERALRAGHHITRQGVIYISLEFDTFIIRNFISDTFLRERETGYTYLPSSPVLPVGTSGTSLGTSAGWGTYPDSPRRKPPLCGGGPCSPASKNTRQRTGT